MKKLYEIGWSILGCFEMIGFVICKLIGELISLIGLGFTSAGNGLIWVAGLAKEQAELSFERDPELDLVEVVETEVSEVVME